MKSLFLFLADGFEEVEAVATLDILRRAGLDIKSVSISSEKEVKGAHDILVVADLVFQDVIGKEAVCLILPGGMPGTKHLDEHRGLADLLKEQAERKGWIAAICAAPSVLGHLGLLQGKKATCYPGFEPELTGAQIVKQPVVVDGRIITANGPGSSFVFALALVRELAGKETADRVAGGMLL